MTVLNFQTVEFVWAHYTGVSWVWIGSIGWCFIRPDNVNGVANLHALAAAAKANGRLVDVEIEILGDPPTNVINWITLR